MDSGGAAARKTTEVNRVLGAACLRPTDLEKPKKMSSKLKYKGKYMIIWLVFIKKLIRTQQMGHSVASGHGVKRPLRPIATSYEQD